MRSELSPYQLEQLQALAYDGKFNKATGRIQWIRFEFRNPVTEPERIKIAALFAKMTRCAWSSAIQDKTIILKRGRDWPLDEHRVR